jgi:two-component system, OmpR family, sensor histidine kinase CiaH
VRIIRPRTQPQLAQAARVAAVTALVIGALYAMLSVVFDVVDASHLVAQVDTHLSDRLGDVTDHHLPPGALANASDDHDVESAPVLLWEVGSGGHVVPISDNAPHLPNSAWPRPGEAITARIGGTEFRVEAARFGRAWIVAAQSLNETAHVQAVVATAEVIAGPVVLLAVFFGALVIGLMASRPVEQARQRQLDFTADASHELRTPLSVIEAEASLALQTRRSAEEYRETLRRVSRESRRLRRIVEDLLWLARFDSEPSPPQTQRLDLSAVAQDSAERFAAVAASNAITLSVQSEINEAWIKAPPEWIDRLTGVLVDNACRYAGPGGTVEITVRTDGTRAKLVVEDSGPGIAPSERSRLFDRFHRATDEGAGSGLGLAIADAVVRYSGGRWSVGDSKLGGAHMEVSWHRAMPIESSQLDWSPSAAGPTRVTSEGRDHSPSAGIRSM